MYMSIMLFRLATVATFVLCTLAGTSYAALDYDQYNNAFESRLLDALRAGQPQNDTESALIYERTLIEFGIGLAADARVDEQDHFEQTIGRARDRLQAVYSVDDLALALPAIRVDFGANWNYVSDAVERIKDIVTPLQLRGAQQVCAHQTTAADAAKLDRLLNYYQDALKMLAQLKLETAATLDDIMATFVSDVWQEELAVGDDVDELRTRALALLVVAVREQSKVLQDFSQVTFGVHENTDSSISAEL